MFRLFPIFGHYQKCPFVHGPILLSIDIHLPAPALTHTHLLGTYPGTELLDHSLQIYSTGITEQFSKLASPHISFYLSLFFLNYQ